MSKVVPTVAVIARIPLKDGHRDAAIAALSEMLANAETEEGTLTYILHTDSRDTNLLWFYEQYVDADSFKAHGTSEFMKSFGPKLAEHLAGRPELTHLVPVSGKGL
jgi:quinol monooxygenase YgiN